MSVCGDICNLLLIRHDIVSKLTVCGGMSIFLQRLLIRHDFVSKFHQTIFTKHYTLVKVIERGLTCWINIKGQ